MARELTGAKHGLNAEAAPHELDDTSAIAAIDADIPDPFDGVRIRYADSGGSQEPVILLDQSLAGERATRSRRSGPRLPSTPACSPSTCRASAHPNAETISCLRERWAGSWPS